LKIYIYGKNEKLSREEIRSAIKFFVNKLIPIEVADQLVLKVKNTDSFYNNSIIGYCYQDERFDDNQHFIVEISNKISKQKQLNTLAHELVHVKQYALSEMQDYEDDANKCLWYGKLYDFDEGGDVYWESPWELEAYGRAIGLVEMHKKYCKMEKRNDRK
jgi:hypothetical protein